MAIVKENDFVELSYIGRIKESNQIFDLTDEELAKKEKVHDPNAGYGPKIICVGQNQILKELDKQIIGKETGKPYTIELAPEKAFGKKDPSLIKIVSTDVLHKQRIRPFPGLQINASGILGTIRSVSGGRTTIDFNHPLAGKNIVYDIKIERIVTDSKEKLKGLIANLLGLKEKEYELQSEGNKFNLKLNVTMPQKVKDEFKLKVKDLISDIEIAFL